jgi:hypothetical protein
MSELQQWKRDGKTNAIEGRRCIDVFGRSTVIGKTLQVNRVSV